jgi:hypothetical protein
MQHSEFVRKLRKINPAIRFRPGQNISSGLYLVNNGPDAYEIGLKFLCAIPSPRFFINIPEFNFVDDKGVWHRGWRVILKLLEGMKVLDRYAIYRLFGSMVFTGQRGDALKPQRYRTPQQKFDEDYMAHATLADKKRLYSSAAV